MRSLICSCAVLIVQLALSPSLRAEGPPPIEGYINFETPSVHALALSEDGRLLALAHTTDSSVYLYQVAEDGELQSARRIPVGWEPTSVRFWRGTLWVVNHLSGTVNEIDPEGGIVRLIQIGKRPWDLLPVSDDRACVTLDLSNELACFDANTADKIERQSLPIGSPRALARWQRRLLISNFHSGNATTILGGGISDPRRLAFPPNVVSVQSGPHAGQNPPFNGAETFHPAMDAKLPAAPPVGLIVRKDAQGHWRDDSGADWSDWVSGERAPESGRVPGWDLSDRDVLLLDPVGKLADPPIGGYLSTVMAIASATDGYAMAGIQARNEIRFEPNLRGRFIDQRVVLATAGDCQDAHCPPTLVAVSVPANLSEVRALQFSPDDKRLYLAARGSNRVGVLDRTGKAITDRPPLAVAAGPEGLAIAAQTAQLYVWSRFASTLTRIDLKRWQPAQSLQVASPEPAVVNAGRRWLYDTDLGSENGTLSCAACHIDGRSDRLAWDLGDPAGAAKAFDQNCVTHTSLGCPDWHPMKGPMRTQSLVDVIGHEPFHWRGDRQGLHDFSRTYTDLHGRKRAPTAEQIDQLGSFLSSISYPPNPYRKLDNTLPEAIDLDRIPGLGRLADGAPLGTGNALQGYRLFTSGRLATPFDCSSCHTLPTGLGSIGPMFSGGKRLPAGAHGESHLGVASLTGVSQIGLKIPTLRAIDEGLGFDFADAGSTQGFGYASDGSVPTLPGFLRFRGFNISDARAYADLIAYLLAFSGGPLPNKHDIRHPQGPAGRAVHAGAGWQRTWRANIDPPAELAVLAAEVRAGQLALGVFVWNASHCALYRMDGNGRYLSGEETVDAATLFDRLGSKSLTALAVPANHADRWLRCGEPDSSAHP